MCLGNTKSLSAISYDSVHSERLDFLVLPSQLERAVIQALLKHLQFQSHLGRSLAQGCCCKQWIFDCFLGWKCLQLRKLMEMCSMFPSIVSILWWMKTRLVSIIISQLSFTYQSVSNNPNLITNYNYQLDSPRYAQKATLKVDSSSHGSHATKNLLLLCKSGISHTNSNGDWCANKGALADVISWWWTSSEDIWNSNVLQARCAGKDGRTAK